MGSYGLLSGRDSEGRDFATHQMGHAAENSSYAAWWKERASSSRAKSHSSFPTTISFNAVRRIVLILLKPARPRSTRSGPGEMRPVTVSCLAARERCIVIVGLFSTTMLQAQP